MLKLWASNFQVKKTTCLLFLFERFSYVNGIKAVCSRKNTLDNNEADCPSVSVRNKGASDSVPMFVDIFEINQSSRFVTASFFSVDSK